MIFLIVMALREDRLLTLVKCVLCCRESIEFHHCHYCVIYPLWWRWHGDYLTAPGDMVLTSHPQKNNPLLVNGCRQHAYISKPPATSLLWWSWRNTKVIRIEPYTTNACEHLNGILFRGSLLWLGKRICYEWTSICEISLQMVRKQ